MAAAATEGMEETTTAPTTEAHMEPATDSTVEAILGPATSHATTEPRQTTGETDVSETSERGTATNHALAATTPESKPTIQDREAPTTPAIRTSMEEQASLRMQEIADAANKDESTPLSPTNPTKSKVKSWLKAKLRSNKPKKSTPSENSPAKEEKFVGGAALTGAGANNSSASLDHNTSSMRDVALATSQPKNEISDTIPSVVEPTTSESREIPVSEYLATPPSAHAAEPEEDERVGRPIRRTSEVSSMTSLEDDGEGDDDDFQEARDNFDEDLAPPPTFGVQRNSSNSSPVRDSKFKEDI